LILVTTRKGGNTPHGVCGGAPPAEMTAKSHGGIMGNTMKTRPRIVLDTNVLVAGLRSRNGASFQLLSRLDKDAYELFLTVPLVMEYEDVLLRKGTVPLARQDVDAFLDMVCHVGTPQEIHFLWRPQLRDPKDELVLEAAVNAAADYLVTHNVNDFAPARRFHVRIATPRQMLHLLKGELS